MDVNREAARAALRRAMETEFAAVPTENVLEAPTPAFEARMEELFAQEKRRGFPRRRGLIAAAIVAACLVLVAWTPVGSMARNLLVTVGGLNVNYQLDPGMRMEIQTLYAPSALPEGFTEIYRETWDDYCFKAIWANADGEELEFWQLAADGINGSIWGKDFESETREVGGRKVLFVKPDGSSTVVRAMAYWSCDGYLMELICHGEMAAEEMETVILSVQPIG